MSASISPAVRQRVLDTLAHYATAVDRGDYEELYAVFAPDGGIRHPNGDRFLGRERLREWLDAVLARPGHFGRQHVTSAKHWEANPDGTLKVYSYWVYFIHLADDESKLGAQGYYEDTLVERDGGWVFQERYIGHWNDEDAFMAPGWVKAEAR